MTRDRRRHALLMPDLGPVGDPFVPKVGQVFWVRSLLYSSTDPAPGRPAVVFAAPSTPSATARIQIVTRTSDTGVPGVRHEGGLVPTLDMPGVFSDLVSCRASAWRSGDVLLVGQLCEPYLGRVLDWFS